MASFLTVLGALFWILGLGSCAIAKGAPGEIEGLIHFLIGSVFFCTGAIIDVVLRLKEALAPTKKLLGPGDKPAKSQNTAAPAVKPH